MVHTLEEMMVLVIEEFEALSKDAGRVQIETLKKILEQNGETEYLQRCGLAGKTDPDSYKSYVPLVTHKDLEPYIHRIADGEKSSILTAKPITTISLTTGTTEGKQKFVPFNDELIENTKQISMTSFAFRSREYPLENGKALMFAYISNQLETKGGLSVGMVSTNIYRCTEFKKTTRALQAQYCSPDEVISCPSVDQSLYCHLLCGLIFQDEIQFISSTFSHSIVHAFRTFEQKWEQLVNDIREGILSSCITVPSVRLAMAGLLKPDPVLADAIYNTISGLSNWHGLIPKLFPNTKYIYGIMTGSMEPYVKKLRHYAAGVPLVSSDYGSSEGWIGVNVNPTLPPELVTFTVLPNIGYYEFVPLREDGNGVEQEAIGLTEVKVGEEYEVIVTNFAGLYRYRLGDVVKVKGFHNSTPELQFICRKNLILNINLDRSTEKDLHVAIEAASKLLAEEENLEVVDFTSQVDLSNEPGHYVIFWEISGEAKDETLNECCNCLDKSFVAGHAVSRNAKVIGALELRILKKGTFRKIMDNCVMLGGSVTQFKTPRCVLPTNNVVLQILSSNVVKTYFSTAY